VVPLVESLLATEDQRPVLIAAAEVLGGCKGVPATMLLLRLLGNPDPAVQLAVVDALARQEEPVAMDGLAPVLQNPDPAVRGRVAQVLKQRGWQPRSKEEQAAFLVASGEIHRVRFLGTAAVGPLTALLRDKAFQRRVQAVNRLAEIGDPAAVNPLIGALQDTGDVVRAAAADGLGRLGDGRARAPLLPLLNDRNPSVRAAAAGSLGVVGDPTVVMVLLPLLEDPHWEVRVAALDSLGRLQDYRATESMSKRLQDSDREVREKAAESLGVLGDTRAVGPLVAALVDADRFVRQLARLALQRINPQWETTTEARAQLEVLRAAMASADFGVQYSARDILRMMGQLPGTEAGKRQRRGGMTANMEVLAEFLNDVDPSVRQAAVEALVRLKDAETLIAPLKDDPDESVAAAAGGEWFTQPGATRSKAP
jgi:HEAT repeat protein